MPIQNAKIEYNQGRLAVILPMTQPTGKIRIKTRTTFQEYGEPIPSRRVPLNRNCYVEWQIGYDLLATDENSGRTSLSGRTFQNYKGETKYAYELSEVIYYSHELGLISDSDIRQTYNSIREIPNESLVDVINAMQISRTGPTQTTINGIGFYKMQVVYPLIIHRLDEDGAVVEVMNREKQRGVGVQPMLYVCIPITSLTFKNDPLNRTLEPRECSKWEIGEGEARMALKICAIFGMLSEKHKRDMLAIMSLLFGLS